MWRRVFALVVSVSLASIASSQTWNGYGGNPQHSGVYNGVSQSALLVHWQALLDDHPSNYSGTVLTHYACPVITSQNTVVYGFRYTTTPNGNADYDNWSVIARSGRSGTQLWRVDTDYSAPLVFPADWTSVFPLSLCRAGGTASIAMGGAGGTVIVRPQADSLIGTTERLVFYTTLQDYLNNQAAYAPIKINTPFTFDNIGNVYFGYLVTGSVPSNVAGSLGTGGVVKLNTSTGVAIYKSVESLGLSSNPSSPAMNAAPAITTDGNSVYFALVGGAHELVKLNTVDLTLAAHVQILDPSIQNASAWFINESSASPMIGPDGHVFMGVFGNQWRESHGWMLQYDANLKQTDSNGKRLPVGAFGWDDTATVVPSSIVPSYTGTAKYLILTKYNNYDDDGSDPLADGSNKLAVLDPTSDSTTHDRQSGISTMNEILTVLGPTKTNNDPSHPNAVNEWCINSAAIDVHGKAAIINSEDGHMYRWSLVTNTLTEALNLQPPTGEAYTSTAIGADGTLFAINNAILFAIGAPSNAIAVLPFIGVKPQGALASIWYLDGNTYSITSISQPAGQVAGVEVDFTLSTNSISTLNINVSSAVTSANVTGILYAFNYKLKAFVAITQGSIGTKQGPISSVISSNASNFVGPGGSVRIVIKSVLPGRFNAAPYRLSVDQATASGQ